MNQTARYKIASFNNALLPHNHNIFESYSLEDILIEFTVIWTLHHMKSTLRLEKLRNTYLHRLLSDKSVEDRTHLFARAKSIFDQLKLKGKKLKRRK